MTGARSRWTLVLLLTVLAATPDAVRASMSPTVELRSLDAFHIPVPGESVEARFSLTPKHAHRIDGLRLKGDGWIALDVDAPGAGPLGEGEALEFVVRGIPSEGAGPLELVYDVDGAPVHKSLGLRPASADDPSPLHRTLTPTLERSLPNPGADAGVKILDPAPIDDRFRTRPWREAGPDPDLPDRGLERRHTLTVRGYFRYKRGDDTWVGADGVTVRVFDSDVGFDELLGQTGIGPSGYFELTVSEDENYPDIYLEFESANTRVEAEDSGILEYNFKWQTQKWNEYSGTLLDVGSLSPSNYQGRIGLHMLSTITKGWRALDAIGFDLPSVDIMYPVNDTGASYDGEIKIGVDRRWREDTFLHEYGHHFTEVYAERQSPNYCNGVCDGESCGHCRWCDETASDAYQEGFASFVSEVCTDAWIATYNYAPMNTRTAEDLAPNGCNDSDGNPCACSVQETEGFLWGLMTDIYDNTPGEPLEDTIAGDWDDPLAMGADEILWVAANVEPTTPAGFVDAMRQLYGSLGEDFWETFIRNGWDVDQQGPGAPINLFSTTHQVGPTNGSTQPWINFVWQDPNDDASGVAGYSYEVSSSGPVAPDLIEDFPAALNNWVAAPLEPGNQYWFTLRARDRSGRWSNTYATAGPYTILPPGPADLRVASRPGWLLPIVPLDSPSATPTSISLPGLLNGSTFFYMNLAGENQGESIAEGPFDVELRIDGKLKSTFTQSADVAADGGTFEFINEYPYVVTGGLHTFEMRVDTGGDVDELTNANNWLANQWAFAPEFIGTVGPQLRPAPPDIDGGHGAMNLGQFPQVSVAKDNCDGLRLQVSQRTGTPLFVAISAHFDASGENLDVGMYPRTTSSNFGFGWNTELAYSAASSGRIDAVIANGNVVSDASVDVGFYNESDATSGFYADYEESAPAQVGSVETLSFLPNEMIKMRHFDVSLSQASFVAKLAVGQNGPFTLRFFPASTDYAGLHDAASTATTDPQGKAVFEFSSIESGKGLLVISRSQNAGTGAVDVDLEFQASAGNWTFVPAPDWFSALVPLPSDIGRPGQVDAPTSLIGDAASTYINFSILNQSDDDTDDTFVNLYYDETCFATELVEPLQGGQFAFHNASQPVTIPGGRHTIWAQIDPDGDVGEANETDNFFARQWVFEPAVLPLGEAAERQVPDAPTAGWQYHPPDPGLEEAGDENEVSGIDPTPFYNCDGLRLPDLSQQETPPAFMGLAVMAPDDVDVDLQLFEASTGPEDGFVDPLAFSTAPVKTADFVVVDLQRTEPRAFDVGIFGPEEGSDGEVDPATPLARAVDAQYLAHAVASVDLGADPIGELGAFTMGNNEILHLYALRLSPTELTVRLIPQDANVDFGMKLMAADAFLGQGDVHPDAVAQEVDAGEVESFTTLITREELYVLAVFKDSNADMFDQSDYLLSFTSDVTSVPGGLARGALFALAPPTPNPMDGSTLVAWDLRQDAHLQVEIYDARGRLVRRLVDGAHASGRREMLWDGRDDTGRQVARGVYMVRASASGQTATRKLTVIR